MTTESWIRWAEDCFGEYRPTMRAEVIAWLQPRSSAFLAALREVALRDHPSVYGKPPGVHELEAFRLEAQDRGHRLEEIRAAQSGRKQIPETPETVVVDETITAEIDKLMRKFRLKVATPIEPKPAEAPTKEEDLF